MRPLAVALDQIGLLDCAHRNYRIHKRHIFRWSFAWPVVKVAIEWQPAADFGRLSPDWHARKVRAAQSSGWHVFSASERDEIAPIVAQVSAVIRARLQEREGINASAAQ